MSGMVRSMQRREHRRRHGTLARWHRRLARSTARMQQRSPRRTGGRTPGVAMFKPTTANLKGRLRSQLVHPEPRPRTGRGVGRRR